MLGFKLTHISKRSPKQIMGSCDDKKYPDHFKSVVPEAGIKGSQGQVITSHIYCGV